MKRGKMLYVAYCKHSSDSGKALAEKLECKAFNARVYQKYPKLCSSDLVINYGTSALSIPRRISVINHPNNVALSAHKKGSRTLFAKEKVPAPELFLRPERVSCFPVIGRTSHHSKASGFWFCNNKRDTIRAARNGATHFIEFIRDTKEFRVHVFARDKNPRGPEDLVSIKTSVKLPTTTNPNPVVKNYENGYRFFGSSHSGLTYDQIRYIRDVSKKALFVVGLHFGAVDIVWKSGNAYVLEVNSAPGLVNIAEGQEDSPYSTMNKYVEAIRRYYT